MAAALLTSVMLYLARLLGGTTTAVAVFAIWPAISTALLLTSRRARIAVCLGFVSYAVLILHVGYALAGVWPLPLLVPNVIPAFVLLVVPHAKTSTERAARVLPASAAGDLATTWLGAPREARIVLGIVTYAVLAALILRRDTERTHV